MNFLTVLSGCRIASFVYVRDSGSSNRSSRGKSRLPSIYEDCTLMMSSPQQQQGPISMSKRIKTVQDLHQKGLEPNDTIYVTFTKLESFVTDILPYINVNVVLITGQWQLLPVHVVGNSTTTTTTQKGQKPGVPPISTEIIQSIVTHSNIMHWFCQNLDVYLGGSTEGKYYYDHPKISPFPYGLREGQNDLTTNTIYKSAVLQSLQQQPKNETNNNNNNNNNENRIYVGYLTPTNKERRDMLIPSSPTKLSKEKYYEELSRHQYAVSPNGDRPECYRHYEAIGLNTIPITQLSPTIHRHLLGSVVYNTHNMWNITKLEHDLLLLQKNPTNIDTATATISTLAATAQTINRNMVFEEYWMEYVERIVASKTTTNLVGPLRWWDRNANRRSTLANLVDKEMND